MDPSSTKVVDVMSSPLESVEFGSKIRDAIAKMIEMGARRLGVIRNGKLVGLVVQKSIVSGVLHEHVPLAELASPGELRCPYCGNGYGEGRALSRHMALVHLGLTQDEKT